MVSAAEANDRKILEAKLIKQAVGLLSQQVWCWGRDIIRPEGNWLLETGFERIPPPSNRKDCASVYSLELPHERCVVLRGFGAFYGDCEYGGVFLPRFEFRPRYTTEWTLECPPWTDAEMPELKSPSEEEQSVCLSLTLAIIEWIQNYEKTIIEQLGVEYRMKSLEQWNSGRRHIVPAEEMVSAWEELAVQVADHFELIAKPRHS